MQILLTAINAKYIHSNPAVYSLATYANSYLTAEEKERCEALKATPYGLCLKHRGLPLAGYHEYRNQDDFCSYGERRTDV